MTDEELAHRRRKADDLVLLNKMARVNGITVKQAHIPILSHILD